MVYQERCKAHLKRFVLFAGGDMAHKRGVYDTLDDLSLYFRGFKKVTQLSPGGG